MYYLCQFQQVAQVPVYLQMFLENPKWKIFLQI